MQEKNGVKKNEINNAVPFMHIKAYAYETMYALEEYTHMEEITLHSFEWFPMKGEGKQEPGMSINE